VERSDEESESSDAGETKEDAASRTKGVSTLDAMEAWLAEVEDSDGEEKKSNPASGRSTGTEMEGAVAEALAVERTSTERGAGVETEDPNAEKPEKLSRRWIDKSKAEERS